MTARDRLTAGESWRLQWSGIHSKGKEEKVCVYIYHVANAVGMD